MSSEEENKQIALSIFEALNTRDLSEPIKTLLRGS